MTNPEKRSRILSISYDPALLHTRRMLLESRGFQVTSAEGFIDAIELCRAGKYDLLIMGHSIPRKDKEAMINEMKAHCPVPVVSLFRFNEVALSEGTVNLDPFDPAALLSAIETIMSETKPRPSTQF